MPSKDFFLLNQDPNKPHTVQVGVDEDLDVLKRQLAADFSIVRHNGIGFQAAGAQLDTLDDILEADGPIALLIDGHGIRNIPVSKGIPYIGSYLEVYPDHLGNHQRMFDQMGPMVSHIDMGRSVTLTNDPVISGIVLAESDFFSKKITPAHPLHQIKDNETGLFVSDTDTDAWRETHKFIPPALSPKAVQHYTPTIQAAIADSFAVFDELDARGEAFNVYRYMFKLVSKAIVKITLGLDLPHFASLDAPLDPLVAELEELVRLTKKVTSWGSWYGHLPFGDPARLRAVQASLLGHIAAAVAAAQADKPDLPMAAAALDAASIAEYLGRATDAQGHKLDAHHRDLGMSIVVGAGFLTTTALVSYLVYRLALHPEHQEALLQELVDAGVGPHTDFSYELIMGLARLDRFFRETQRLHNPAFQPTRVALRDAILPGGFFVEKGRAVTASLHHIHKNPALWDDPMRFDPDRWATHKVRARDRNLFIPFASGQRMCIGFNLAVQESKILLVSLLLRYRFVLVDDEPVEYDPLFLTVRPMNLYVRAIRRTEYPPPSAAVTT